MSKRRIKADLAVIGAGSGGLSAAAGAAQLGLRVVLYEKGEMGGDCLNFGCVPSKALIAAAKAAHVVRAAAALGVRAPEPDIDFLAVMTHVRRAIAEVAPHDSQARFEGLGVDVVREAARFTGPRSIESATTETVARRVVVATGSRPAIPDIPGLADVAHLTNETVFDLRERPERLLVLGGGPIGVELGQAFRRLGSDVVLIDSGEFLTREDRDLAGVVQDQLARDGVTLVTRAKAVRCEACDDGAALALGQDDRTLRISGSHLLVAVGRTPNVEGLNLEAAGIAWGPAGIVTDDQLRTTNRAAFAVGDVAGRGQFTHLAGAHAALAIRRIAFGLPGDAGRLVVPRVTYADPELAVVGLTEGQAREVHGDGVKTVVVPFADIDRAAADGDTRGFAKLVATRRGELLGVGVVGAQAGDLIQPWTLAMTTGLTLRDLTSFIAPYPTRGDIHRRLAGAWFAPLVFSAWSRRLVSLLKHFG